MAAILKFKMAATRGVSGLGPNRKLILQGSPTSVLSFIISPQSEIFFDLAAGLRRTRSRPHIAIITHTQTDTTKTVCR